MTLRAAAWLVWALGSAAVAAPRAVGGQEAARPESVRLIGARLSTADARLGEPVGLTVVARVPPDHTLHFPDALADVADPDGWESVEPVRWSAAEAPADSVEVTLVYRVRSFAEGTRRVPALALVLRRGRAGIDALEGARVAVGRWDALAGADPVTLSRRPILPGRVQIRPPLPLAAPREGHSPRPAADVVGRSWGVASLALGAGAALLVVGASAPPAARLGARILGPLLARGRGPEDRVPDPTSLATSLEKALAALDALSGSELLADGRADVFYERLVHAIRTYLDREEPSYRPALTDRELIDRLGGGEAAFAGLMRRQEVVRFWIERPGVAVAAADLETARRWLLAHARSAAARGRGTPGPPGDEADDAGGPER